VEVDLLIDTADFQDPYAANGRLYFVYSLGGDRRIHSANIGAGPNGEPTLKSAAPVAALATGAIDDEHPVVTVDGLEIFFASRRSGDAETNIHRTVRNAKGGYDPPQLVTELRTEYAEKPTWISPDACDLFYFGGPANGLLKTSRR
jgi:hypothetical protein